MLFFSASLVRIFISSRGFYAFFKFCTVARKAFTLHTHSSYSAPCKNITCGSRAERSFCSTGSDALDKSAPASNS